ncbi:MAG: hypothetical protein IKR23_00160 [Lachnospiraceae bacterium]|nr:hypothetical protein [Lachnospiraceae bacterium]
MSTENTGSSTASDIRQEIDLLSTRRKRCLFAFFLMLILFLPYAFMEPFTSDTNDDTAMNLIAAGAFGEDSQFLVYSNIVYGYFLKALFFLFPGINWYLTMQLCFNALAAGFIGMCLAYFIDNGMLIPILLLLHFRIAIDNYRLVQFTRNAYLYALCGIVLLSLACVSKTHRIKLCIAGGFFLLLSFVTRAECFYLMVPFLLLMFTGPFLRDKKRTLLPLASFLITGITCLALGITDNIASRRPAEWAAYFDYHFNGTFPVLDNDINRWFSFDDEDSDNLDMIDLLLLNEYHYADPEYYSVERLKKLQEDKPDIPIGDRFGSFVQALGVNYSFPAENDYLVLSGGLHNILDIAERSIGWNVVSEAVILLFITIYLIKKQLKKTDILLILSLVVLMLCEIFVTVYMTAHAPKRATIGPLTAAELLTVFTMLSSDKRTTGDSGRHHAVIPVICLICAGILIFPLRFMNHAALPENTETGLVLDELRQLEGEHYLLDSMILWGERMGVSDIRKISRSRYEDFFSHYTLSGGWLAETPLATHYTLRAGISAPMTQLAVDPHFHYVVRSWKAEYLVPLLNDYLSRRTGKDLVPAVVYAGNDLYVIDFISSDAQ